MHLYTIRSIIDVEIPLLKYLMQVNAGNLEGSLESVAKPHITKDSSQPRLELPKCMSVIVQSEGSPNPVRLTLSTLPLSKNPFC